MLARIGKQALFTAESVQHPDAGGTLEKIFGDTGFMSPEKIRLGLKRCEAVGRVEETTGDGVGTGFAIPGTALSRRLAGQLSVRHEQSRREHDGTPMRFASPARR